MFFAITPVRSCPIYLICQYPVWIVTGSFLEPFHSLCQTGALVIRFERYFFDPSVHIFLLLIQCSDRQIQTCFFFCCCISVTHELFQIPYVPCNITKLFSQGFPYFLCTVFFCFWQMPDNLFWRIFCNVAAAADYRTYKNGR